MNKRFVLFFLTLLYLSTPLFSDDVILAEAKQVASTFFNYKLHDQCPDNLSTISITETIVIEQQGEPLLFIFNFLNKGFVIVPADDRIYPVVGFSLEDIYNKNTSPDAAEYVIRDFSRKVMHVRVNNIPESIVVSNAWKGLRNSKNLSFLKTRTNIDAMLVALWHQNSPYNAACPDDPEGPGGHVVAGCVSTAMSMLMYHWRFPLQGTGSHSYTAWGYGVQTVNFGESDYDYSGMVNSSDNTYNEMIAKLMYHCGVSVEMNYSANSSGASSSKVAPAIKDYFNYSSNAHIIDRTSTEIWKINLNQQMILRQPVYYRGCDDDGCHAFVADGMQEQADETYYHFNFGWSGSSNGWYLVTDAGDYNQDNRMIKNFVPDPNLYPYDPPEEQVVLSWLHGSIEDYSGPKMNYQNNMDCSWLISPQTSQDSVSNITLTFSRFETQSDFDLVRVYDGPDIGSPLLAEFSGMNIPPSVSSSGNHMLVTFTTNGKEAANGWQANYHAHTPTWCNGIATYTEPSGNFDDGSGAFWYNNNTACMYRIIPDAPGETTLSFNSLDTEEGFDIIKVFDLESQELLSEISGDEIPEPVISPSGQFFITFITNNLLRGNGWEVSYETEIVGIEELNTFQNLRFYPNPATDELVVSFSTNQSEVSTVSIFSITGIKVFSESKQNFKGLYNRKVDVSSLKKGIYILRLRNETASRVEKFIIE